MVPEVIPSEAGGAAQENTILIEMGKKLPIYYEPWRVLEAAKEVFTAGICPEACVVATIRGEVGLSDARRRECLEELLKRLGTDLTTYGLMFFGLPRDCPLSLKTLTAELRKKFIRGSA